MQLFKEGEVEMLGEAELNIAKYAKIAETKEKLPLNDCADPYAYIEVRVRSEELDKFEKTSQGNKTEFNKPGESPEKPGLQRKGTTLERKDEDNGNGLQRKGTFMGKMQPGDMADTESTKDDL